MLVTVQDLETGLYLVQDADNKHVFAWMGKPQVFEIKYVYDNFFNYIPIGEKFIEDYDKDWIIDFTASGCEPLTVLSYSEMLYLYDKPKFHHYFENGIIDYMNERSDKMRAKRLKEGHHIPL